MSLQVRYSPGGKLYEHSRDVAHNFKFVVETMADRMDKQINPDIAAYLSATGTTDMDVGLALQAFIHFVVGSVDNPQEDMFAVLTRVGWFSHSPSARLAVMAHLGMVLSGVYFNGVREATLGGDGPCADVKELQAAGARVTAIMCMPPWRLTLLRWRRKFSEVLRGLRRSA